MDKLYRIIKYGNGQNYKGENLGRCIMGYKHVVILLLITMLILSTAVIYAKTINVDGDPSDWITASLPANTGGIVDSEYVWVDARNDTRNDIVAISIDGSENDWIADPDKYFQVVDLYDKATGLNLDGANLNRSYVGWNENYLYIAFETQNTASWTVNYGIGIDINGPGSGYVYDSTNGDANNIHVGFSGAAIDYEIYFSWTDTSGLSGDLFAEWTGSGWSKTTISGIGGSYAYSGDTSSGLQFMEVAIPWSALGGSPTNFSIIIWVAGQSGFSSAVDTVPYDSAVEDSGTNEWTDTDTLSNLTHVVLTPKISTYDVLVDLTEFHITCNETHLFFLLNFQDLYKVGVDGAPGIMIALDLDNVTGSGGTYLGYNSETQVASNGSADWERQILIDLSNSQVSSNEPVYGDGVQVWNNGSPLDVVDTSWEDVSTNKSVFVASTDNDTVEVAIAWSDLGISDPRGIGFKASVGIVRVNPSGDAWDISGTSDVLDAVTKTGPNTWDEVQDGYIDYYTPLKCSQQPDPVPENQVLILTGIIVGAITVTILLRKKH